MAKRRFSTWVTTHVPLALLLNPFELFLAVLCILSGLPMLLNFTPEPTSLEALLPSWVVFVWGLLLVVGGVLTFVGVVGRHEHIEKQGMSVLAPAAVAYAVAIFFVLGGSGSVAGAIVLAFGLACGFRRAVLTAADRVREREADR